MRPAVVAARHEEIDLIVGRRAVLGLKEQITHKHKPLRVTMAVGVHVAPDAVDDRVVVRDAAVGIEAQYLARIGGMIARVEFGLGGNTLGVDGLADVGALIVPLLPDGVVELAVGPETQATAVVVIPRGHVAQDYFGLGNLPGLRIIVEPDDAGVFPAAVHICMRDIDVVLAAVFAEIGIKGDAEHAFMLRPDLHVRNAADELFLARFGIHADNAAPLALGNPNMIIRPPDHIPRGGKAFGDNDPFKRFRRWHHLCLLRRCAPRSRSAQKQQRHRACHDSGMVHPVPPDVSLCIGTRGPPPRGFRYCQKREALRVPVRQRKGKNASPETGPFQAGAAFQG